MILLIIVKALEAETESRNAQTNFHKCENNPNYQQSNFHERNLSFDTLFVVLTNLTVCEMTNLNFISTRTAHSSISAFLFL